MKYLKKTLLGFIILLVLVVAAAMILPVIFKDEIKASIDTEIEKMVNADVVYDADDFNLSVFKHFPAITLEMNNLSVYNREPFADTQLFALKTLDIEVNLMDVLFGDQIRIKGITLIEPQVHIAVLEDGRANYDIAKTTETEPEAQEEATSESFSFGIDHWEIVDGMVAYHDASIPYDMVLAGLNHTGKGDFNEKAFDLALEMEIDSVSVAFDGVSYLSNKHVSTLATLGITDNYSRYTFKQNQVAVNEFILHLDGWFAMNDVGYDMDITFDSPDNTFKSLLSLVPGVYTKDFDDIETEGNLQFGGYLKGKMEGDNMPGFNLSLAVSDAMLHYPDLPEAIKNVQMDLLIDNPSGVIENTVVNLKDLHLELGSNPLDASVLVENLKDYKVKAEVVTKLDLAELTRLFPLDSLELRGMYNLQATVDGVYDSIRKKIPTIDAKMSLTDGYIKSGHFPLPIEQMELQAHIKNTTGYMAATEASVDNLSMVMDGESFSANGVVRNLDDYTWDVGVKGGLDLDKITKIFPVEGTTLAGKVRADLTSSGKYSDLVAERYGRLPTSGTASVESFVYKSVDLPYQVALAKANTNFDPRQIKLTDVTGTIGRSDFTVNGSVQNYIGYIFSDETLKGNMEFRSSLLDLNEFMEDTDETSDTSSSDTTTVGAIQMPENLDFVLHSAVKTTKLMDYTISNAKGDVRIKDGIAHLDGLKFDMLDGDFVVDGTYDARDIEHPTYDLALKVTDLAIGKAASSFSIIKKYAPIAGMATGNFSTDFKLAGELKDDMTPQLSTVSGDGMIKIARATIKDSKLLKGVTSLTKLNNIDNVSIKDALMSASIKEGKLHVEPFDVKFGDYTTTVAGSTAIDGGIDYKLKMDVPAGKVGSQVQGFLNQYTGATNTTGSIPVKINLGGTFLNPKPKLIASEQKAQVKQAVTNMAKEKAQEAVGEVLQGNSAGDIIGGLLGGKKKSTDGDSNAKKDSTKATQVDKLKGKINGLFKKKKN